MVVREQPTNIDKEKGAVLKAMQELEVKSVQEGALRESEEINADSKKKHADKQAPMTFAEAEKVYNEAKGKIATAYHDQQEVRRLGAEALFAARTQRYRRRKRRKARRMNRSDGTTSEHMYSIFHIKP